MQLKPDLRYHFFHSTDAEINLPLWQQSDSIHHSSLTIHFTWGLSFPRRTGESRGRQRESSRSSITEQVPCGGGAGGSLPRLKDVARLFPPRASVSYSLCILLSLIHLFLSLSEPYLAQTMSWASSGTFVKPKG